MHRGPKMRTYLVLVILTLAAGVMGGSLFSQPAKLTGAEEKAQIAALVDGVAAREAILDRITGVINEYVWPAPGLASAPPGNAPAPPAVGGMPPPAGMPGPTPDDLPAAGNPRGAITAFWLRDREGFADHTAYGDPPACQSWHHATAMQADWTATVDYSTNAASIQPANEGSRGVPLGAAPYRVLSVVGSEQVRVWREWLETADETLRPTLGGHETVNGVPCDIMCFQNKIARLRFWVAPSQGYCIMRSDELIWEAGPGQFGPYRVEERSDVADLGHGVFVPRRYQRQVYRFRPLGQPQWQWASTWQVVLTEASTEVGDRRLPDLHTFIPAGFAVADARQGQPQYRESRLKELRNNPPPEPELLLAPGQQPSMDRIPQAQP